MRTTPSTSGLLIQEPARLEKPIFDADAAGFQLVVHAIGDRANATRPRHFREAASAARRARPPSPYRARAGRARADKRALRGAWRHRLDPAKSLHRRHALGGEAHRRRHAAPIAYNVQVVRRRRRSVAFGTDWFVEPLDPMLGLYAAVTRQFPDGTPAGGWFPEERITLAQAIEYYTLGSAYAEFAETRRARSRRQAGRPRRPVARPVHDPAARDPRHAPRS